MALSVDASLAEPRCLRFEVIGDPQPQAALRSVPIGGGRRASVYANARLLMPWRATVAAAARNAAQGLRFEAAVRVRIEFRLARPLGHYGKRGLRPSAPRHPYLDRRDLDHLERSLLDALKVAAVIRDDRQVCSLASEKVYGDPGALIVVEELP